MNPNTEQLLKYMTDLRAFYLPYHNHKEASAWAAVAWAATVLGLILVFIEKLAPANRPELLLPTALSFTALVMAYTGIMFSYIKKQFQLRSFAADVNAAAFRWSARILASADSKPIQLDLSLATKSDLDYHAATYLPTFILDEVKEIATENQRRQHRARTTLEKAAYWLLGLTALASLFRIWYPVLTG